MQLRLHAHARHYTASLRLPLLGHRVVLSAKFQSVQLDKADHLNGYLPEGVLKTRSKP